MKLVLKNYLTSFEDCERTKKELELIFHKIKSIVFKRVRLKKGLLSFSITSFFFQIYTAWHILIGFAYSLISVGFRAIFMSLLSFLSQKIDPGDFLKLEVILSRSYLRKCSI